MTKAQVDRAVKTQAKIDALVYTDEMDLLRDALSEQLENAVQQDGVKPLEVRRVIQDFYNEWDLELIKLLGPQRKTVDA